MKRLLIFLLLGAVIACMIRAAMEAKSAQTAANQPHEKTGMGRTTPEAPTGPGTMTGSGG